MRLKSLVVAGLAVVMAFVCATAEAAVISAQDDNIDFLLTPVEDPETGEITLQPKLTGTLAEGDVLVSVFELQTLTVDGVNIIPDGMEVTGIAVIQITSVTDLGGGILLITFQPYTEGFNAVSPVDVTGGDAGEGAMIAMWMNSTEDFDLQLEFGTAEGNAANCFSLIQCLAEASAGNLLQVDGFAGDLDEFWVALTFPGGGNVEGVAATSGSVNVASFNAALTTFENNIPTADTEIAFQFWQTGEPCPGGSFALDGCVAGPTVTGPILGGAGLNAGIRADGAFARSDLDASKLTTAAVPGPSALMLMGIGLVGLAALRRRK